jgi:hypothetical protein
MCYGSSPIYEIKQEKETQSLYGYHIEDQQGPWDKEPSRKTAGTVDSKEIL